MNVVRVKPGVEFTTIAPGGFRILAALDMATRVLQLDLWITSACDGPHSGPDDPHHRGEAYDIRTHDFTEEQKQQVLSYIVSWLGNRFYAFLENAGGPDEHIHCQVARGTTYP